MGSVRLVPLGFCGPQAGLISQPHVCVRVCVCACMHVCACTRMCACTRVCAPLLGQHPVPFLEGRQQSAGAGGALADTPGPGSLLSSGRVHGEGAPWPGCPHFLILGEVLESCGVPPWLAQLWVLASGFMVSAGAPKGGSVPKGSRGGLRGAVAVRLAALGLVGDLCLAFRAPVEGDGIEGVTRSRGARWPRPAWAPPAGRGAGVPPFLAGGCPPAPAPSSLAAAQGSALGT